MKQAASFCLLWLCLNFTTYAQDWIHYTASDGVGDFELYNEEIWAISAAGLSKIDVNTQQTTTWSTLTSDLPDYGFNKLSIDTNGDIWLGGFNIEGLTKFDGNTFVEYTDLDGFPIMTILDLKAGTNGKLWIFGYFEPAPLNDVNLFYHENGTFTEVSAPGDSLHFSVGTKAQIGVDQNNHVWAILQHNDLSTYYIGEFDGDQWTVHDLSNFSPNLGPGDLFTSDSQGNVYVVLGTSLSPNFLHYDGNSWAASDIPTNVNNYLNQERPLFMDDNDLLWISLRNNSFLQYDGQNWATVDLADYGLQSGFPDGIEFDDNGQTWIYYQSDPNTNLIYERKLYRFDGNSPNLVDLGNSDLPSNQCFSLLIDAQNNKWVATDNGLVKFDGTNWITYGTPPFTGWFYPMKADSWNNIWFLPGTSALGRFDGQVFTQVPLVNSENQPYDWLRNIDITADGTLYAATDENEVLVYDQGETSYLFNMVHTNPLGGAGQDVSWEIKLSPAGTLYNSGFSLGRHDGDDEWTEIPYWSDNVITNSFYVGPNEDIWLFHGIILPGGGPSLSQFSNGTWELVQHPFNDIAAYVEWDSQGNAWTYSEEGLCKQDNNGDWTCYNQSNSPIIPDRIRIFRIDESDNIWILLSSGGILVFNENSIENIEGTELPAVSGCIYRDYNQNEVKDPDDLPLAQQKVMLLPDSIITFTNTDGTYRIAAPPGEYEVQFIPDYPWEIDNSPAIYDVTLTVGDETGFDFRVTAAEEVTDLQVFLNEGFPRCNQISYNWINYWNYGTETESGEVRLGIDPLTSFVSANPQPDYSDGDTLVWAFTDLQPLAFEQIYVQLQMPNELYSDSIIVTQAFIDKSGVRMDSSIAIQTILCAYDPNDKMGNSSGEVQNGQSLLADPLEYTIRFQNTGNDTAFTVIIRDTLDAQLDWNSFEVTGASHAMETSLRPDGALEFLFEDIMLPDSNINEPASHGFVSYRIRVKDDLLSPVLIENTAYIYFDLNAAIVTNTTVNVLVDEFVGVYGPTGSKLELTAFPNPTSGEVFIHLDQPIHSEIQFQVFDARGVLLSNGEWPVGQIHQLSLADLPSGYYILRLNSEGMQGILSISKNR